MCPQESQNQPTISSPARLANASIATRCRLSLSLSALLQPQAWVSALAAAPQDVAAVNLIVERLRQGTRHLANIIAPAQAAAQEAKKPMEHVCSVG
jgi:hypothetical protein